MLNIKIDGNQLFTIINVCMLYKMRRCVFRKFEVVDRNNKISMS
jgi:hypothetical protein